MQAAKETAQAAQNKLQIREFYERIYNGRELSVLATFVSDDYTEHNPEMRSGRATLEEFLKHVFHMFPEIEFKISRLVAEDDLVVVHTMMRKSPSDSGSVIAEFFRLDEGMIVERWDVTMPIPADSKNELPLI